MPVSMLLLGNTEDLHWSVERQEWMSRVFSLFLLLILTCKHMVAFAIEASC